MNLSKSKYTRYCQCPKMLWLDTYHPELAVPDPARERRFREGNEVGDLAMGLLGEFVETTAYTPEGKLDISSMQFISAAILIPLRRSRAALPKRFSASRRRTSSWQNDIWTMIF